MRPDALLSMAKAVLHIEAQAVAALAERIGDEFVRACKLLLDCQGRVVVIGMGKSGHIARKLAATLASTGTPAFFLHPAEASHGDLGMVTRTDTVIALSNSGETAEILALLPLLKRQGVPVIGMTGQLRSTLAQASSVCLDVTVAQEACPLGLAPTASTTAMLAMGDALAVSLLESRGFTEADFARSHPGGTLGKRLLLHVEDLMHRPPRVPRVPLGTPLADALLEMTRQGLGMTTVVDADMRLQGVFTDGDLRRALADATDLQRTPIEAVMTPHGTTVAPDALAVDALNLMEARTITAVVVVDAADRVIGAVHMHDLLRAGVV
ncbi:MAG TPA: KpsF/GutQ family sugar-phosphate isomerase [Candidatus Acidoferrales bacterium]|nr:KpsF/GutQ family sugar-phosphate isomerase [Candidatus Acidoferrales bacterium]